MSYPTTYHIGTAGQAWSAGEKALWLNEAGQVKREYKDEVLAKLEPLKAKFDVEQYGSLSLDAARYPLFSIKTRKWDAAKPSVLVTGGVHGYETSGVQGALLFAASAMEGFSSHYNIVVCPCVSPWGYECIQRWNPNAEDPNRGFMPNSSREECAAVVDLVAKLGGPDAFTIHVDLHETTDSDATEFRPAKAARDGVECINDYIPDGFYLVQDSVNPQAAWHTAIIDAVRAITHIAPPDAQGAICGVEISQEGVLGVPTKELFLCSSVTNAAFATTTEVYPDSPKATDEQCNRAQVAAVVSALSFVKNQQPDYTRLALWGAHALAWAYVAFA